MRFLGIHCLFFTQVILAESIPQQDQTMAMTDPSFHKDAVSDVNSHGIDDVIVGAFDADPNVNSSASEISVWKPHEDV